MKPEVDVIIKLINLWWIDYYLNDDFPDSAFIRFGQELKKVLGENIKVKYDIPNNTWILK